MARRVLIAARLRLVTTPSVRKRNTNALRNILHETTVFHRLLLDEARARIVVRNVDVSAGIVPQSDDGKSRFSRQRQGMHRAVGERGSFIRLRSEAATVEDAAQLGIRAGLHAGDSTRYEHRDERRRAEAEGPESVGGKLLAQPIGEYETYDRFRIATRRLRDG